MKTMSRMLIGVTAVVLLGTTAFTQFPAENTPKRTQIPRLALINVNRVFGEYSKAVGFEMQIADTIKPFRERANKVYPCFFESFMRPPPTNVQRREMAVLQREFSAFIQAKHAKEIAELRKEIGKAIKAVAECADFAIVLDHGGPIEPVQLWELPVPHRDVNDVIDRGGVVAAYIHPSEEITDWVTRTLQSWAREKEKRIES